MSGTIAQNVGRNSGLIKTVAAGGEWTLISTQTASASATISFTSGLDSTYDEYCFKFINIHPASTTYISFNGSIDGGSNYNVAKTTTHFRVYHIEDGSDADLTYDTWNDLAQGTGFQNLGINIKIDNDASGVGYLYLYDPSSTSSVKNFIAQVTVLQNSDYNMNSFISGYLNTTSAVDAIQFKMSSGNMDSGTISLYGIG